MRTRRPRLPRLRLSTKGRGPQRHSRSRYITPAAPCTLYPPPSRASLALPQRSHKPPPRPPTSLARRPTPLLVGTPRVAQQPPRRVRTRARVRARVTVAVAAARRRRLLAASACPSAAGCGCGCGRVGRRRRGGGAAERRAQPRPGEEQHEQRDAQLLAPVAASPLRCAVQVCAEDLVVDGAARARRRAWWGREGGAGRRRGAAARPVEASGACARPVGCVRAAWRRGRGWRRERVGGEGPGGAGRVDGAERRWGGGGGGEGCGRRGGRSGPARTSPSAARPPRPHRRCRQPCHTPSPC